jgi:uncharacterized membrane protein YfcA
MAGAAVNWSDAAAIAGGLVAGFLSGTIGVGGGIAFVPIMTVGFKFSQALAHGTSLVAIIPTSLVGGITHLHQGNVRLDAVLWLGSGGALGAAAGAVIAVEVPGTLLARLFGAFLLFSAVAIALDARRPRATPAGGPKSLA